MELLFTNITMERPTVSIILLDWTCRESFHFLTYINNQNIPRDQYEVIWIEYYSRRSPEIRSMLDETKKTSKPPVVDRWIVMDMPKDVYYHKHLMYNIGIALSSGEIVVICDSDAIVTENFVKTIIDSFRKDPNIVLHLDEFRNTKPEFHPFNYPPIADIIREGCINNRGGKTAGVVEEEDPLHVRNYGACMCAKRDDLIEIGGADEHIDFLGHICGPYDMTFRLMNLGRREVWHSEEFLYHTWHPGQAGVRNYLGPHDGKHMSTTSLNTLKSGRILPLTENNAIHQLRTKGELSQNEIADILIQPRYYQEWTIQKLYWPIFIQKIQGIYPRFLETFIRVIGFKNQERLKRSIYQLPRFSKRPVDDPVFVGGYHGYKLVKFKRYIYGVPDSLYPIDFFNNAEAERPEILRAECRRDLKKLIKMHQA